VPCSLADAEKEYSRWLHDDDPVPTRAVLATYVANMCLDGDPVWLMLVGGSGVGKTERIMPVTAMPNVVLSSTITGEAALLSATPKKDRADSATGGLLRQLGEHGMLILKDFTSVLSMSRDARAAVLAALREVYDGRWDRNYGSDGGQTLTWKGKCGLLAGCTTAIDSAHSVLAAMGTRFVFVRLPRSDLGKISQSALEHMGKEQQMRTGLAEVTAGLLANLPGEPHDLGPEVTSALVGLACLASQARSPVQRDWKGEIELVLDAEAPTRLIKQLGQLWRACGMLGLGTADSWEVVRRAGIDSVPKLRGSIIRYLAASDRPQSTTAVADAVDHPTRSALRALEDLFAHGVVTRITAGQGHAHTWELSGRARAGSTSREPCQKWQTGLRARAPNATNRQTRCSSRPGTPRTARRKRRDRQAPADARADAASAAGQHPRPAIPAMARCRPGRQGNHHAHRRPRHQQRRETAMKRRSRLWAPCTDCGAETLSAEPGVPTEYYMVHDRIWRAARHAGTCASAASKHG